MGSIPIALRGHNPVEWLSEIAFVLFSFFRGPSLVVCLFVCIFLWLRCLFMAQKLKKQRETRLKAAMTLHIDSIKCEREGEMGLCGAGGRSL